MNITIQRNESDDRAFNKSISTIANMTGYLRDDSSVIDPVILVEGGISTLAGANYMTISEFGRSYFITNIESVRNNLVRVTGHVDVLTTYKDAILANTGIIRRQENLWTLYLDDGSFKVYNNPIVLTRAFPSGFSTMSFILAVAGD